MVQDINKCCDTFDVDIKVSNLIYIRSGGGLSFTHGWGWCYTDMIEIPNPPFATIQV